MEYPEFVAKFYDLIYDRMRSGIDAEYYLRKIKETRGPVLEIGVGTGRFFIEAINQGADMYGIDISKKMLDILLQKLNPLYRNRISHQGAVDFKFKKKFDLILAPFRIFSHLLTIEEQLAALNNAYDHLTAEGRFIFDLYVPDPEMIAKGINKLVDFEGEYEKGKKMKRIIDMKADIVNQISYINMKFVWVEDGREVIREWPLKFRFYFRYELEHLIERSKLTLDTIYGDFNENKLQTGSREFVVICKKQ